MRTDRIRAETLIQIAAVKAAHGWTDKDLAEQLGCSVRTVANIKKSPVSSRYTVIINCLYREAMEGK